jgi:hypothetical protein
MRIFCPSPATYLSQEQGRIQSKTGDLRFCIRFLNGGGHPWRDEARVDDVLIERFCKLLKEAEHSMDQSFEYQLRMDRKG